MADAFTIDVQDREVQAVLSQLLARTDDLTPPMEDVARILGNVTEDAFLTETSPFGDPWAPLKSGREGKILQDSGQLAASVGTSSGKDYAELTVGKIYGAIHQFGGQAGRGRKVTIPARPYAPINEQGELPDGTQAAILDVLSDYLVS